MDPGQARLRQVLSDHSYSITAARTAVFMSLQASGPITPADLINSLSENVDRASVYRTIHLFEKLGIIHRLQAGWKYRLELSDQFMPHHHHLFCVSCGQYFELPADKRLEDRVTALASSVGFTTQEHQIEIKGVCAQCSGRGT